jgi:ubiquitin carboxyl-terminal hydrolase 8
LQEYIKASIIIVDIIPRHKDYPELKSDRGDLHRLYSGLQKRINMQHDKFEEIKEVIKEDNARSGVQPTLLSGTSKDFTIDERKEERRSRPLSGQIKSIQKQPVGSADIPSDGGECGSSDVVSLPSSAPTQEENSLARRRPPVQRKPDALHGKVIRSNIPSDPYFVSPEEDLAARFSKLRGVASNSPVQDPRIRTQPIGMPDAAEPITKRGSAPSPSPTVNNLKPRPDPPLGPRDMPKVPTGPLIPTRGPINVEIPSMPKLPDAIYSPAWNLDNPASLEMLRSTSRHYTGGGGRPHAVSSTTHLLPPSTTTDGKNGQSVPPHSFLNGTAPKTSLERKLPDSLTVTAEELMEYLQIGSHELSILLVDIRDRKKFDDSHIMSHSIICIEPIILRKEISAEELEQSLVLAPDAEQHLFNARHTFDLLVYYDQSSSSNEHRVSSSLGQGMILRDFSKAVYDYGYEKRLKKPPRLLVGGLDAWVDLVGPNALETPQLSNPTSSRGATNGAPDTSRVVRIRETNYVTPRRKIREVIPLTQEEQKRRAEAFKAEAAAIDPDALTVIRTTEDFLRRFPEPSAIQESMISPSPLSDDESGKKRIPGNSSVDLNASNQNHIPLMPQIPTRPAPALPRQSYSGVSERTKFSSTTNLVASPFEHKYTDTISQQASPYGRTGLENLGQTCYMNSVLQALKGMREFRNFIIKWNPSATPIPGLPGESDHTIPFLMIHFYNMIIALMSGGKEYIKPLKLAVRRFETGHEDKYTDSL